MKGSQKEKIMVVSNHLSGKEALKVYRKRWGIERLFGHLKRKGFDLEATHMTCPKKLEKLFAISDRLHLQLWLGLSSTVAR